MKKLLLLSALIAAGSAMGQVDWPLYRGDARRTGVQRREHILGAASLDKIRLLWTRKLGERPLTAPTILGRLISHRGFLELVFIADADGDVFAIDDDLNRIFWRRHIPQTAQSCDSGLRAAPVFPPLANNAIDSDEDNPYAPRPVYVLSGDGKLYKLSPMTGEDMSPPVNFVPPNAQVSNLNYRNKTIYTTTSGECGAPAAVWALNTVTRAVASYRAPVTNTGITVGTDGTVYAVVENGRRDIVALGPNDLKLKDRYSIPASMQVSGMAVFKWQGHDILAVYGTGLFLLDGKNIREVQAISADSLAVSDVSNTLRLYAASKTGIVAFTVKNSEGRPTLKHAWSSKRGASTIAVANGIVYALSSERNGAVLYALDALTGREVYSSRNAVDSAVGDSGLVVANGHVCFGTKGGVLYCFGLPIDL